MISLLRKNIQKAVTPRHPVTGPDGPSAWNVVVMASRNSWAASIRRAMRAAGGEYYGSRSKEQPGMFTGNNLHQTGRDICNQAQGDSGERMPDDWARTLRALEQRYARKAAIIAAMPPDDPEVVWRAARMRTQVTSTGPIPLLIARRTNATSDGCPSCGDPIPEELDYRCVPCARAAQAVL